MIFLQGDAQDEVKVLDVILVLYIATGHMCLPKLHIQSGVSRASTTATMQCQLIYFSFSAQVYGIKGIE